MWTRSELKYNAKVSLRRFLGAAIVVCLIALLLSDEYGSSNNSSNSDNNNSVSEIINPDSYVDNEGLVSDGIYNAMEDISNYSIFPQGIFNGLIHVIFFPVSILLVVMALLIRLLVGNTIKVGLRRFFMCSREYKTSIGTIAYGFSNSNFLKTAVTMLCVDVFTFLWSLLFVIPGIIKSYEYRMIPYILSENPQIDRQRAFELSKEMMYGQKMDAFILDLSFIVWDILAAFTWGILNIFYLNPYKTATNAELYAVLRSDAINRGITNTYELPGYSGN